MAHDDDSGSFPAGPNTGVIRDAKLQLEKAARSMHWWIMSIFGIAAAGFVTAVYLSSLAPKSKLEEVVQSINTKIDKQADRIDRDEARLEQGERRLDVDEALHKRMEQDLRWQLHATYEGLPARAKERVSPPPVHQEKP